MFGFLKRKAPPVPPDPKAWQRRWHAILNDYPHPDHEPESPDPLPDMGDDLRLHFMFWMVGPEARKRAFAILPRGDAVLARIEAHLASRPKAIGPEEAIAVLRHGLTVARSIGADCCDPNADVVVKTEEQAALLDAFSRAGSPFQEIEDRLGHMALAESGAVGQDAFFFLSEPLYRLSTTYDVANWLAWPLCGKPGEPDPTEAVYRLWQGGWSAGHGDDLFVFDRRKEFGLI